MSNKLKNLKGRKLSDAVSTIYKIKSTWGKETPTEFTIDWTVFPSQHVPVLKKLGDMLLVSSPDTLRTFYNSLGWIYKFMSERNLPDSMTFLDFDVADWGAFCTWLARQKAYRKETPLSLNTRRTYVAAIRSALSFGAYSHTMGITYRHVDRLVEGSRRHFRHLNLLSARRAAERAWTDQERETLLEILREEWLQWREFMKTRESLAGTEQAPDLLAVVAAYLVWEETVRTEEINVMTIDDLDFGDRNCIFLHAPNKTEGWIEVDDITVAIVKSLVKFGELAREELGTRRLFVDPYPVARSIGSGQLNHRLRKLLTKYKERHFIDRPDVILADGRKTLGSRLAADTDDREVVRIILRHKRQGTMMVYYVRQGERQLAKNIETALRPYAVRLSMAYNQPVIDPLSELPAELVDVLRRNPNHDVPYGACLRDAVRVGPCGEAIHCGECPKLVPMSSKIGNFIAERDLVLTEAAKASHERSRENLRAHAAMLEAHILNITRRVQEGGDSQ